MAKPTIYIPDELYEELEADRVERGLKDRAPIVQEALRHWLVKHRHRKIRSRSQARKKLRILTADLIIPKLSEEDIKRFRRIKPHNPHGYKEFVELSDNPSEVKEKLSRAIDEAFEETEEGAKELLKESVEKPKKKVKKRKRHHPKEYYPEKARLHREAKRKWFRDLKEKTQALILEYAEDEGMSLKDAGEELNLLGENEK